MLYLLTANNGSPKEHLKKSVLNKISIKQYYDDLDLEIRNELNSVDKISIWGLKNGKNLSGLWEKISLGEMILIYTEDRYAYSAKIIGKAQNDIIANNIWGKDSNGDSWENLLFLDDIQPINLSRLQLNFFFDYSPKYFLQGFSKVSDDKLKDRLKVHETIDNILLHLNKGITISEEYIDSEYNYQREINNGKNYQEGDEKDLNKRKKPVKRTVSAEVWERNVKVAKKALLNASFKCEIDRNHNTFEKDKSGNQFMEAHHLIPMKEQYHIKNNLDVVSNVVSLCPNCHRKIHYSDLKTKTTMLENLYNDRQEALHIDGLNITLDELIKYYSTHD